MHAAPLSVEKPLSEPENSGHEARPEPAPSAQPDWLTQRTIRILQLALVIGLAGLIVAAYWLHPGVHAEVNRAMAVLVSGDGMAIGDYLHSFGIWAPFASIF